MPISFSNSLCVLQFNQLLLHLLYFTFPEQSIYHLETFSRPLHVHLAKYCT
jgi:hypothetical protein